MSRATNTHMLFTPLLCCISLVLGVDVTGGAEIRRRSLNTAASCFAGFFFRPSTNEAIVAVDKEMCFPPFRINTVATLGIIVLGVVSRNRIATKGWMSARDPWPVVEDGRWLYLSYIVTWYSYL